MAAGSPFASDAREIARYVRLYRKNFFPLSWNFDETVRRLGLDEKRVSKLEAAVEILYASNVHHLDELFGDVVEEIRSRGLLDESLIAFTADHGEVMYRGTTPFQWSHGMQLAPEALTVPLIVRAPGAGVKAGAYAGVSRSIDVFPTLAGLSGLSIDPKHGVQGVDLSPALRGESAAPDLTARSHTTVLIRSVFESMQERGARRKWGIAKTFFPDEDPRWMWVSIVEGDRIYKWRNLDGERWGMEVFDLATDAAESRNLYDADRPEHREMLGRLLAYKEHLVKSYLRHQGREARRVLPRGDEAESLRSLGYIE